MLAWMTRHPVASNLLLFVILVGGFFLGSGVRQEIFPEYELDVVTIQVSYPGVTPRESESSLVIPMENALQGIAGIQRLTATALEGGASLRAEIRAGEDVNRVKDQVQTALDRMNSWPEDAKDPQIQVPQLRNEVLNVMVYGQASARSLREWALAIRANLLDHPEIGQVELELLRNRELSIEISPETLSQYDLTFAEVGTRIQQATLNVPGGRIQAPNGDLMIRTHQPRQTALEFARLPIISTPSGQVLLGEIATIQDGFEEGEVQVRYNGMPAERLQVLRVGNQTPTQVSQATRQVINELRAQLPTGIQAEVLFDRSLILQGRIDLLLNNLWMGLLLVFLVLALFLNLQLSFWIMLGIPVSFAGAFLLLPALDASINMISLFAFILVLGIVVDDAIVVGENIYSHRERGQPWMSAAIDGAREILGPVLITILTTIAAFLPFFFIPGTTGKFFLLIPYVVIATLIFSLVEAFFILPAHLGHPSPTWISRLLQPLERVVLKPRSLATQSLNAFVRGPYQRSLAWSLEFRYATLATGTVLLLLVGGLIAGGHLRFTFFPKIDSDVIFVRAEFPFGTQAWVTERLENRLLTEARTLLAEYEDRQDANVSEGIYSAVGRGGSHRLDLILFLRPLGERGFSAQEFSDRWQGALGEVAGLETLIFNASTSFGDEKDLTLQLSHPDPQQLEHAVQQLQQTLSQFAGVGNLETSQVDGREELRLRLRPEGEALGLTERELARQVSVAYQGMEVTRLQRDQEELQVLLRLPLAYRQYLRDLLELPIATPSAGKVPLERVAFWDRDQSSNQIVRVEGRQILKVQADVDPHLGNAQQVLAALQQDYFPNWQQQDPLLRFELEGNQRNQQETFAGIFRGSAIALFLIYALLALQFRNYAQPLIIMVAIPFGIVGAVIGHLLLGYDLSIVSVLGLVALSGVVVNDSLILVDYINRLREKGIELQVAVVEAGMRRFRPILLTSLTTFLGLLPIVFEQSLQARYIIPMAIGLAFGVLFSTFIILFLVPTLYLILQDFRQILVSRLSSTSTSTLRS